MSADIRLTDAESTAWEMRNQMGSDIAEEIVATAQAKANILGRQVNLVSSGGEVLWTVSPLDR